MLIAFALFGWVQTPAATAADFFPLLVGTKRTFVESGGNVTTEEVLPAITIDGKPATPVVQRSQDKVIDTIYYRVDPDAVYLLGYNDPKKLLALPMPILQFKGHPETWQYAGLVGEGRMAQQISLVGRTRVLRTQTIFGKEGPVIEVTLDATMGVGPNQEHLVQTAKYAAGVGMYEFSATSQIGRRKTPPVLRKLTNIEGAKPNG